MADVVRTTREPMVGQIRLAWWRERLEELDSGSAAPAEPRLQAVANHLRPLGLAGADAAAPEEAWAAVLTTAFPWNADIIPALASRGEQLFANGGRLLNCPSGPLDQAGAVWALMDFARHCSDAPSRRLLVEEARQRARALATARFASAQRPLTGLAALAVRDLIRGEPFEPEATRGRALVILRHSVSGRLSRII